MRGNLPESDDLLQRRGSYAVTRRSGGVMGTPTTRKPKPPAHLDDIARAEWDRLVGELHRRGVLAKVDTAALEVYVTLYSRWRDAECKLKVDGVVVTSPKGYPIQNPYLSIANRAAVLLHKFACEFGTTPVSRRRVRASEDLPPSPKSRFFTGGQR